MSFLYPGQTPVVNADQPLFVLAKPIQWEWPNEYSENKFVVMFVGLHIEMACFKVLGYLCGIAVGVGLSRSQKHRFYR